jgi:hypothetical protein
LNDAVGGATSGTLNLSQTAIGGNGANGDVAGGNGGPPQTEPVPGAAEICTHEKAKHIILELNLEAGRHRQSSTSADAATTPTSCLGAGQIVGDRGGVSRRYRGIVGVDHLIDDLLQNFLGSVG